MAIRFKFKISKILSFKFCRSKEPSSLPALRLPSFLCPSPAKQRRRSSFKRNVSSAFGCGICRQRPFSLCLSDACLTELSPSQPPTPRFHWERQGKWHVIARIQEEAETPRRKVYTCTESNGDVLVRSGREKIKRQPMKATKTARRARVSSSSADESVIFTSGSLENDVGEETETLISPSRGFSAEDSSPNLKKIQEAPHITKRRRRNLNEQRIVPKRCASKEKERNSTTSSVSAGESDRSPARLSTFVQRFVPCAAVAVVKRSEDPYEDFKGSMMEMVMEKKMWEAAELERLLRCFLTLNSRRHHAAIVGAFSEIWEVLFSAAGECSWTFK